MYKLYNNLFHGEVGFGSLCSQYEQCTAPIVLLYSSLN